jgi:hypothetical protein
MKKDKDKLRLYRPSGVEVGQELTIKNAAKHCLYLELERYRIDGRSALGHEIAKSRDALVALFPDGKPDAAANVLINNLVGLAGVLENPVCPPHDRAGAGPLFPVYGP